MRPIALAPRSRREIYIRGLEPSRARAAHGVPPPGFTSGRDSWQEVRVTPRKLEATAGGAAAVARADGAAGGADTTAAGGSDRPKLPARMAKSLPFTRPSPFRSPEA